MHLVTGNYILQTSRCPQIQCINSNKKLITTKSIVLQEKSVGCLSGIGDEAVRIFFFCLVVYNDNENKNSNTIINFCFIAFLMHNYQTSKNLKLVFQHYSNHRVEFGLKKIFLY